MNNVPNQEQKPSNKMAKAVVAALLAFLLTLWFLTEARKDDHAKQSTSPAPGDAEMFRGTPDALDQLGRLPPDGANPVPPRKQPGKQRPTAALRFSPAQAGAKSPAARDAAMFRGTQDALDQLGKLPPDNPKPTRKEGEKQ